VFSFHAVKNLPTADSGMVCFADAELDAVARHWTWLGIDKDTYSRTHSDSTYKWHYEVEHVGFKYHGNSIMAALGVVALKYVDADNACRRPAGRLVRRRARRRRGHRDHSGRARLRILASPLSGAGRPAR
jgi:dTDP-4-amino-4,6-dideoxygalactose transaminase